MLNRKIVNTNNHKQHITNILNVCTFFDASTHSLICCLIIIHKFCKDFVYGQLMWIPQCKQEYIYINLSVCSLTRIVYSPLLSVELLFSQASTYKRVMTSV